MAVFALVVLVPVVAWFSWHHTEHYGWTVQSASSDGRTLTLEVGGYFGSPTAHVHEGTSTVRIDLTSPMGHGPALVGQPPRRVRSGWLRYAIVQL